MELVRIDENRTVAEQLDLIATEPSGLIQSGEETRSVSPQGASEIPGHRPRSFAVRLLISTLGLAIVAAAVLGVVSIGQQLDLANRSNRVLAGDLSDQKARVAALEAEVQDLKERWFGSPPIWQPSPIPNAEIEYFDVTGRSQPELIASLDNADICTRFGPCSPDPAAPKGGAWGLEGIDQGTFNSTYCYSPTTVTARFRIFVLLPRWSPPADGSVRIPLVEAWNSLAQTIYTHEAGHAAIDVADLAILNDQAHHLPSCQALSSFWKNPSIWDKDNADQLAYHARLRADCRPEVGCIPPGWLGWG